MKTPVSLGEALRLGHIRPVMDLLAQSFQSGLTPYPEAMQAVRAAARHSQAGRALTFASMILKRRPLDSRSWRIALISRMQMGDWKGALEAVRQCFRLGDDDESLRLNEALLLELLGDTGQALEILDRHWTDGSIIEAEAIRARALLRIKDYRQIIQRLSGLLREAGNTPDINLAGCWKALGQAYDHSGQFDLAFRSFQRGNELAPGLPVQEDTMPIFLQAWQQVATKEWVESWRVVEGSARAPVFLVGFPRSGTTLLEQMLDAHPDIQALEEKPAIDGAWDLWLRMTQKGPSMRQGLYVGDDLKRLVSIVSELASITDEEAEVLRNRYYEVVSGYLRLRQGTTFVDKQPLNYLYIPFILRLFPDARFIVALRDPADCVLSGFMQHFQVNPAMIRMKTLKSGVAFYADTMNLFAQYRRILNLEDRLCFVRYEGLVQDWRGEATRLLDFIGVGWHFNVEEYRTHAEHRGTISTPSYQAVTGPLQEQAIGRWRRYEAYIGDDFSALQPFRECWGYV